MCNVQAFEHLFKFIHLKMTLFRRDFFVQAQNMDSIDLLTIFQSIIIYYYYYGIDFEQVSNGAKIS